MFFFHFVKETNFEKTIKKKNILKKKIILNISHFEN